MLLPVQQSNINRRGGDNFQQQQQQLQLSNFKQLQLPPPPVLPPKLRNNNNNRMDPDHQGQSQGHTRLIRSTSNVTKKSRTPITKPLRRSKSQHVSNSKSYVTSIQHGGSVTLVSLSGGESTNPNPRVVHHHHFMDQDDQDEDPDSGFHTGFPHPHRGASGGAPTSGVKIKIEGEHSYGFPTQPSSNKVSQ